MASKKRRQYADRELARSVERVVVGGEKAAAVSREANIPYRTLAKYVRRARAGESITRRRTGPPPMLTADGERRLLVWMRALQQQGLPVRRRELMDKANGLLRENATAANEQLSAGWYKRFRQRHPEVTGSSTDLAVDSEPPVSGTAASSVTSEAVDSDQPFGRRDGVIGRCRRVVGVERPGGGGGVVPAADGESVADGARRAGAARPICGQDVGARRGGGV